MPGTVTRVMFLGDHAEYLVTVPQVGELQVDVSNPAEAGMWEVGAEVRVSVGALHALPAA